jgi:hypothetical protein
MTTIVDLLFGFPRRGHYFLVLTYLDLYCIMAQ